MSPRSLLTCGRSITSQANDRPAGAAQPSPVWRKVSRGMGATRGVERSDAIGAPSNTIAGANAGTLARLQREQHSRQVAVGSAFEARAIHAAPGTPKSSCAAARCNMLPPHGADDQCYGPVAVEIRDRMDARVAERPSASVRSQAAVRQAPCQPFRLLAFASGGPRCCFSGRTPSPPCGMIRSRPARRLGPRRGSGVPAVRIRRRHPLP